MEEREELKENVTQQTDTSKANHTGDIHGMKDNPRKSDRKKGKEECTKELEDKQQEYDILYDKHLRLLSEFDNYRKRTTKERSDLLKTAGEDVILSLLPVLDDLDRAVRSTLGTQDITAIKEGIQLIINKLNNTLAQKGLQAIEAVGQDFDTDLHEAITDVPAPSEELKGKVIDETEKGYMLGNKVIRYSKVVVGK